MSGITRGTGLEIFTQPHDLEISICQGKGKGKGKYAVLITRGPGHDFKLLISTPPVYDTPKEAADDTEQVLKNVFEAGSRELRDAASLSAQIINPGNQPLDQDRILNLDLIARIMVELRKTRTASTYKMTAEPPSPRKRSRSPKS